MTVSPCIPVSDLHDVGYSASCWLWPSGIIESLLLWGPVTVFPWWSKFSLLLVSVITGFYGPGLSALSPTPNLEDNGTTPSLVSILRLIWHGWPYQESKTPADIAIAMGYWDTTIRWWSLWGGAHRLITKKLFFNTPTNVNSDLLRQRLHCTSEAPLKVEHNTRVLYPQLTWYNSLWLWRWLPHRLSKRQSLSTTTVLFRATFTLTIKLNLQMNVLFIVSLLVPLRLRQ